MKIKFFICVLIMVVFKQSVVFSDNLDISVYTGTFDVMNTKEGDDQTSLIGIEQKYRFI